MLGRADKAERIKEIDFSIKEILRRGDSLQNRQDIERLKTERKSIQDKLRRS